MMVDANEGREIVEEFAEIIAPLSAAERLRVKDALTVVKFFCSKSPLKDPNDKESQSDKLA